MTYKEQLGCDCPESAMMLVQYEMLGDKVHPEHHDGISEITCTDCGKRVGRWSGRVLTGDDYENRYGRE